jgi:2,3-bisphosphoglycerate-dependent phosphoglycerate mutase
MVKYSCALLQSVVLGICLLSSCILLPDSITENGSLCNAVESGREKILADSDLSAVTRFLLVRHGRTDWNDQNRIQGSRNIPLNEKGMGQAQQVALFLASEEDLISGIYASDLQRAFSTGEEIATAFNQSVIAEPGLREMSLGIGEGMLEGEFEELYRSAYEQLEVVYTDRWERWHHHPAQGAETKADGIIRIEASLRKLAKNHVGQTVVAVTHGAMIKTFITHLTEKIIGAPNCCVAEFHYFHDTDTFSFKSLRHSG